MGLDITMVNLRKMEYYFEGKSGVWIDFMKIFEEKMKKLGVEEKEMYNNMFHNLNKAFEYYDGITDINEPNSENYIEIKKLEASVIQLMKNLFEYDGAMDILQILEKFPLHGIKKAFKKFQTQEVLFKHEESAIINFANRFTTCTLNKATLESKTNDHNLKSSSFELLEIIRTVNIHNHTKTCRKYDTSCRFGFGKFPIWKTLISKPCTLPTSEKQAKLTEYKCI